MPTSLCNWAVPTRERLRCAIRRPLASSINSKSFSGKNLTNYPLLPLRLWVYISAPIPLYL